MRTGTEVVETTVLADAARSRLLFHLGAAGDSIVVRIDSLHPSKSECRDEDVHLNCLSAHQQVHQTV